MTEFSKEQLRMMLSVDSLNVTSNLAKALLAQMERAEKAEELVGQYKTARYNTESFASGQVSAATKKVEIAEAERDRLAKELAEAEGAIRYFATKVDLARPAKFHPIDTRRTVIFSCKADGTWNHDPVCSSAVRRAMERGK